MNYWHLNNLLDDCYVFSCLCLLSNDSHQFVTLGISVRNLGLEIELLDFVWINTKELQFLF